MRGNATKCDAARVTNRSSDSVGVPHLATLARIRSHCQLDGLGQTLVLGGALYEQQLDRLLSNPLLAGLPLVGQWFQRRKHGTERFELLVFVTPRIVNP
mgnify:CR=1 FL=1